MKDARLSSLIVLMSNNEGFRSTQMTSIRNETTSVVVGTGSLENQFRFVSKMAVCPCWSYQLKEDAMDANPTRLSPYMERTTFMFNV